MKYESPTCHCKSQPINIILGPFDRDERVYGIDRILELLIESRYGPGAIYQPLEIRCFLPRINTVNFDLMPKGFAPTFSNDSCKASESKQTGKAEDVLGLEPSAVYQTHAHSPSTLARGSPHHRHPNIDL